MPEELNEEIIPNNGENEDESEPEQPATPRDIHVLIGLTTYQGMTDEEIELIINFRANIYATGIAAEHQNASLAELNETWDTLNRDAMAQAQANFETACGGIEFKTVELEQH